MARQGKIARLPFRTRELLNERLLDNENGPDILAWLNKLARLEGPASITPQNLSEWRAGGFAEWLEGRQKVERTKSLAEYCHRMAQAGGGNMDMPAAIAGGQLMEVLEQFDPSQLKVVLADKPDTWIDIIGTLAKLQKSKADSRKADQNEIALKQNDRKLALEESKFQRTTCELYLKWYANKRATEIAENKSLQPSVKIEQLRQLMFGEVSDGE